MKSIDFIYYNFRGKSSKKLLFLFALTLAVFALWSTTWSKMSSGKFRGILKAMGEVQFYQKNQACFDVLVMNLEG